MTQLTGAMNRIRTARTFTSEKKETLGLQPPPCRSVLGVGFGGLTPEDMLGALGKIKHTHTVDGGCSLPHLVQLLPKQVFVAFAPKRAPLLSPSLHSTETKRLVSRDVNNGAAFTLSLEAARAEPERPGGGSQVNEDQRT